MACSYRSNIQAEEFNTNSLDQLKILINIDRENLQVCNTCKKNFDDVVASYPCMDNQKSMETEKEEEKKERQRTRLHNLNKKNIFQYKDSKTH